MNSHAAWLFLAIALMLLSSVYASHGADEWVVEKKTTDKANEPSHKHVKVPDNSILVRNFHEDMGHPDVMHVAFLVGCKLGFKNPLKDIKDARRLEGVEEYRDYEHAPVLIIMKSKEIMMKWIKTFDDKLLWTQEWYMDQYNQSKIKPKKKTRTMPHQKKVIKGFNVVVNLYPKKNENEDIMQVVSRIGNLLGIKSPQADVKDAYRIELGIGDKSAPIVISLVNKGVRTKWVNAYHRVGDNENFVLSEHLMKNKANLLVAIKQWALIHDFETVWSKGHNVFLKKNENSTVIPLHSFYGYVLGKSPILESIASSHHNFTVETVTQEPSVESGEDEYNDGYDDDDEDDEPSYADWKTKIFKGLNSTRGSERKEGYNDSSNFPFGSKKYNDPNAYVVWKSLIFPRDDNDDCLKKSMRKNNSNPFPYGRKTYNPDKVQGYNVIINGYPQTFRREDIVLLVRTIGRKLDVDYPLDDVKGAHRLNITNDDTCKPIAIRLLDKARMIRWSERYKKMKKKNKQWNEKWYLNEYIRKKHKAGLMQKLVDWAAYNNFELIKQRYNRVLIRKHGKSIPLHVFYAYVLDSVPFLRYLSERPPTTTLSKKQQIRQRQIRLHRNKANRTKIRELIRERKRNRTQLIALRTARNKILRLKEMEKNKTKEKNGDANKSETFYLGPKQLDTGHIHHIQNETL
ncbi:hypothetical protein WDU94_008743 [Cyamophila willieti]